MNFTEICRICTCENSVMTSVFESYKFQTNNFEIFKVIIDCASVQIDKSDGFPQQICWRCLERLSQAYSFKKLCEDSDYKFRNDLIENAKTEVKSECFEESTDTANNVNTNEEKKIADVEFIEVKREQYDDEIKTENMSGTEQDVVEQPNSVCGTSETMECEASSELKDSSCTKIDSSTKFSHEIAQNLKSLLYGNSESSYKCELCSKNWPTKILLALHMKTHSDEQESEDDHQAPGEGSDDKLGIVVNNEISKEVNYPKKEVAKEELLPKKPEMQYESVYKAFMDWRTARKISKMSEGVLLLYFRKLSEKHKSSSLWAQYSMLKSTLNIKSGINIESYSKLRAFLGPRQGYHNYQTKMFTFTADNINTFIKEAPDLKYLAIKVALIMGMAGACSINELHSMKIEDIKDLGSAITVKVPNTKVKVIRMFTISGKLYQICQRYAELRPNNAMSNSFFLHYKKGRCTTQQIGINNFKLMGKDIAAFLRLPNANMYTGQSLRRTTTIIYPHNTKAIFTKFKIQALKSNSLNAPSCSSTEEKV